MNVLRSGPVVVTAVLLALAGYLGSLVAERQAWSTPTLRWVSLVTVLALAVALLVSGLWVRRTQKRTARRAISRLAAVRVLVLAQAAAYAGAALGGWHLGVLAQLGAGGGFGSPTSWNAVALVAGGLVLVVVGFVVQAMCKLPPEDPDGEPGSAGGAEGVEGAR